MGIGRRLGDRAVVSHILQPPENARIGMDRIDVPIPGGILVFARAEVRGAARLGKRPSYTFLGATL